jgi:uncharacterized ParB-like nuclease family protein
MLDLSTATAIIQKNEGYKMSAQSYQAVTAHQAHKAQAQQRAAHMFEKARSRNWLAEARSVWNRQSRRLLNLKSMQASFNEVEMVDLGEQVVSLTRIKGSANAGRAKDFDIDFRPLNTHTKDRWLSVAAAQQQGGKLPPVILTQVGDVYYVEDGHHRISVAKAMGEKEIIAKVTLLRVTGSGVMGICCHGQCLKKSVQQDLFNLIVMSGFV